MAIDPTLALREGFDDLASARGAVLYAAFLVFTLASLPIHQTLTRDTILYLADLAEVPPSEMALPATPLALDVGVSVLVASLAVIFVVAEALRMVAIRAFASEAPDAIPTEEVTAGGATTFVVLLVVSLLTQIAIYGGLVAFVLPGLLAGVLTMFVRQAVLLEDAGVVDAFRRSFRVVVDEPLQVLGVLLALVGLGIVAGLPVVAIPPTAIASPLAGAVIGTVVTVYGIAVITRAFQQAGEESAGDALGPEELADEPA